VPHLWCAVDKTFVNDAMLKCPDGQYGELRTRLGVRYLSQFLDVEAALLYYHSAVIAMLTVRERLSAF